MTHLHSNVCVSLLPNLSRSVTALIIKSSQLQLKITRTLVPPLHKLQQNDYGAF